MYVDNEVLAVCVGGAILIGAVALVLWLRKPKQGEEAELPTAPEHSLEKEPEWPRKGGWKRFKGNSAPLYTGLPRGQFRHFTQEERRRGGINRAINERKRKEAKAELARKTEELRPELAEAASRGDLAKIASAYIKNPEATKKILKPLQEELKKAGRELGM